MRIHGRLFTVSGLVTQLPLSGFKVGGKGSVGVSGTWSDASSSQPLKHGHRFLADAIEQALAPLGSPADGEWRRGIACSAVPVLVLAAGLLAGCSGSDSEEFESSADPDIQAFVVETASQSGDAAVIDPAVEGGGFALSWTATAPSDPYVVSAYASYDASLSDADVRFFGQNCGAGETYDCDNEGLFDCAFTSDNQIDCEGGNDPVNLQDFFTALPQAGYVVLEVCDGLQTVCTSDAHPVIFQ